MMLEQACKLSPAQNVGTPLAAEQSEDFWLLPSTWAELGRDLTHAPVTSAMAMLEKRLAPDQMMRWQCWLWPSEESLVEPADE